MNLTMLQYFREVANSEQMTKSARKLKVAQPALSRAIKKLESEVGQELFTRHYNRIELNLAGQVILKASDNIINEWEKALNDIKILQESSRQQIVMNVSSAGASVAKLISQFKEQEPNASFIIHSHHNQYWVDKECDVFLFASIQENIHPAKQLRREPLYVSVGASHPLAKKRSILLKDCSKLPFLFADEDNDMYSIQMHYCRLAGFTPQIAIKTDKQNIIFNLLQLGQGIALQPKLDSASPSSGIVQIPIKDFHCCRYIHLMLNPQRVCGPQVKRFQDFCIDYFSKRA